MRNAWWFLDENLWWMAGVAFLLVVLGLEHCQRRDCIEKGWAPEECAKL